jgi:hypothetical protein
MYVGIIFYMEVCMAKEKVKGGKTAGTQGKAKEKPEPKKRGRPPKAKT